MVTVTGNAKELLQMIDRPVHTVLKLEPLEGRAGELGLISGAPQETDQVIERDGADVLHVPAAVSEALDGAVIDSVDTPEGPRLSIKPPR